MLLVNSSINFIILLGLLASILLHCPVSVQCVKYRQKSPEERTQNWGKGPNNLQSAHGSVGIIGGPARQQVGTRRLLSGAKRVETVPTAWKRHVAINEGGF